jgi:adenosine deaminase
MVDRARDEGLFFNTCPITSVRSNLARRAASIARMRALGLNITLNTDDPQMFKTDIGHSYRVLFETHSWDRDTAIALSLAGVDACWLSPTERADLRQEFKREIKALEIECTGADAGPEARPTAVPPRDPAHRT